MLMDKLPTELFIDFLFSIDDLNSLKSFCQINKGARELWVFRPRSSVKGFVVAESLKQNL
jgi:hypothetical protein